MITPKQRAKLAARECSSDLIKLLAAAERVVQDYSLYKKFIDGTPLENDIVTMMASFGRVAALTATNSLPLEQLFAVEDAIRQTVNSNPYFVGRADLLKSLLALDNWRKEREKK